MKKIWKLSLGLLLCTVLSTSCSDSSSDDEDSLGTCDYEAWVQNGSVPWCLNEKLSVACFDNEIIHYRKCSEKETCVSFGNFGGDCRKNITDLECDEHDSSNKTRCYGDKLYKCVDGKYKLEKNCADTGYICVTVSDYGTNDCAEPCTKKDMNEKTNWFICDNEKWGDYVAAVECRAEPVSNEGNIYYKAIYNDSYEECINSKCIDGKCIPNEN